MLIILNFSDIKPSFKHYCLC